MMPLRISFAHVIRINRFFLLLACFLLQFSLPNLKEEKSVDNHVGAECFDVYTCQKIAPTWILFSYALVLVRLLFRYGPPTCTMLLGYE